MSGFFALIRVRIALKSVSLSVVRSRATMETLDAFRGFSTSVAMPSPYAVLSSTTATFFAFSSFAR